MQDRFTTLIARFMECSNEGHARKLQDEIAREGRPIVLAALRRYRVDPEELGDLAQQSLIQFLDGIDRTRREGRPLPNPSAYVRTIVTRCVIDRRRGPRDVFTKSIVYLAQRYEHFSMWSLQSGEVMIGLSQNEGQPMRMTSGLEEFERDPQRFVHRALGGESAFRVPRATLMARVLEAIGTPLPKTMFCNRLADVLGIAARGAEQCLPTEPSTDPRIEPVGLEDVWGAVRLLGRNALASFLLARSQEELVALTGEADPKALLQSTLGLDQPDFDEIWQRMPLDDGQIATELGTSRANVHTMRSRAITWLRGELASWRATAHV